MRPFWDSSESKLCVCKLLLIHACICKSLSVLHNYQRIHRCSQRTLAVFVEVVAHCYQHQLSVTTPINLVRVFLTNLNAVVCLHFISSTLSRSNTLHTLACTCTFLACIYTCVACICTCMVGMSLHIYGMH